MASIVNMSGRKEEAGGGLNTIIGLILLAVVLYLLFVYGLPTLNQNIGTSGIDVNTNEELIYDNNLIGR